MDQKPQEGGLGYLLTAILENLDLGVLVADQNGQVAFVNDRCLALCGVSPSEAARLIQAEYLPPLDVKRGQTPLPGGFTLHTFTGDAEEVAASPAQNPSEQKYSSLFQSLDDVFCITSLDGTIKEISPSVARTWGGGPEELIGRKVTDFYVLPGDREKVLEILQRKKVLRDHELVLNNGKGEKRYFSATISIGVDGHGNPEIYSLLRDISLRKEAEEQIRARTRLLDNLDKINLAISSSDDLDSMVDRVLEQTLDIYGCDRAFLTYPCDPDAPYWSVPVEKTTPEYPGAFEKGGKVPMTPGFAAAMRAVLNSGTPITGSFGPDQSQLAFEKLNRIRSRMVIAVRPRFGKPWLFGLHHCRSEREWTQEERDFMGQIARRLADALSVRIMLRELTASEERFRSIVSSMADWVWECDKHGRFTWASEKVTEILGYTPEEVVGKESFDFMPEEEARRLRTVMLELSQRGLPLKDLENWNITKEGKLRCLLTNGVPTFDQEGNLKGYRGVDKDITTGKLAEQALKESEQKFRELFSRTSIGIIISSMDQKVLDANPEALKILGYTLEEMRSLSAFEIIHPEDLAERPPVNSKELALDNAVSLERRYKLKSGEYIPVLTSISRNSQGEFLIMFQDLTSRHRLERRLVQAQKMEAVGTLSSGIAHDFNNILQAIMGFSQLLAEDKSLPPGARAHIQRIEASVGRGAALVKNLLTFSRAEKLSMGPVDVNHEVTVTAEMLGRTLPKMISIKTSLAVTLPPIAADAAQVEQVLINLATNARDAMRAGGVLTFETSGVNFEFPPLEWPELEPGSYVRITVTDTGTGMDRETASRIFEPFFTTKEVGKGTGLGLSSAYGIIKNHGGHIRCVSRPGQGTTFTILFPASTVATPPESQVIPAPKGGEEPPPKNGTVLVVDDEDDVRDVALHGLSVFGYTTVPARSGEEALSILEKGETPPDVVLLDLGMPGMGGEKCLEMIKEKWPELNVIVASGYAMPETPGGLYSKGASAFIKKPYRLKNMAEVIRECLKKP